MQPIKEDIWVQPEISVYWGVHNQVERKSWVHVNNQIESLIWEEIWNTSFWHIEHKIEKSIKLKDNKVNETKGSA